MLFVDKLVVRHYDAAHGGVGIRSVSFEALTDRRMMRWPTFIHQTTCLADNVRAWWALVPDSKGRRQTGCTASGIECERATDDVQATPSDRRDHRVNRIENDISISS